MFRLLDPDRLLGLGPRKRHEGRETLALA